MRARKSQLVAIAGGSGAGKTWLAERLCRILGDNQTARICLDDFYSDRSHLPTTRRAGVNFDHPEAIDWPAVETALGALSDGCPAAMPCYDFVTHTRRPAPLTVRPCPVVLVEGLWLLRRASLRRLFQWRVFIECPARLRFKRRLQRDVAERGRDEYSVRKQYFGSVLPMHERFVAGQVRWANVVLRSPVLEAEAVVLAGRIRAAAAMELTL